MASLQHGVEMDEPIWTEEDLVGFLGHSAPSVRLWALERLLNIGAEERLREVLIQCLRDSDFRLVNRALSAIFRFAADFPLEPLRSCMSRQDLSRTAWERALSLLAALGDTWARKEMLDRIERGECTACRSGLWAHADGESLVRAVRERWSGSTLPPASSLLRALIALTPRDLIGPILEALGNVNDEVASGLFLDAVEEGASWSRELPEPEGMAEVKFPGEVEPGDFPFVAMPEVEEGLKERGEKLRSQVRAEHWEGVFAIALNIVEMLDDHADDRVRELRDFAWGLTLARRMQERTPRVGDKRFRARAGYELFCGMLATLATERTLQETDSLPVMLSLLDLAGGDNYSRLRERIWERWREEENRHTAEQVVNSWLDATQGSAYVSKLWFANALEDYPLSERVLKLCEKVEKGDLEEEAARTAAEFIGEYLAAHPQLLREQAQELLGGYHTLRLEVLRALCEQNRKWATEAILEALDSLLQAGVGNEVWDYLRELGDPAALDRAVEEWRPDEPMLAKCAGHLARLDGSFEELPEELRKLATEWEKREKDLLAEFEETDEPAEIMDRFLDAPLRLPARCTRCGRTYTYEMERVFVARDAVDEEGRDLLQEVVPGRVITCKNCGAQGSYEFTEGARLQLVGGLIRSMETEEIEHMRIIPGTPHLSDGTPVRKPSEAIRYLRDRAEENPDSGEWWRRLGNMCEKFGEPEQAEEAWRKAVEVDETEVEAAFSLARFLWAPRDPDGPMYALEAIQRLPEAELDDETRRALAEELTDMLHAISVFARPPLAMMAARARQGPGDRMILDVGQVDLRRIERWDRLADLLAENAFQSLRFTAEMSDEEQPTALEAFINYEPTVPADSSRAREPSGFSPAPEPIRREKKKVGRNDPCPCGSGRKYKHCCGRNR